MNVHRYSAKYVEIVADTAARDFLLSVGLLAVPGVFAPAEPTSDRAFGEAKVIEGIDPSAMRDDPGFWRSLLFDVANGDYRGG